MFEQYDLDPRLLEVLKEEGISEPTPIQAEAIPHALAGRDVVGVAQTGTGKTLGFALPSLTRLAQEPLKRGEMLVLTPTRELCEQVHGVVHVYGAPMKMRCTSIYGGVGYQKQNEGLKKGSQVVVATPGRLIDHMERGNVSFEHLRILILDEADRMLDMGFLPDITWIVRQLPKERQTLMFSATFPPEIARFAEKMMRDPIRIEVGAVSKPVETVRQILYPVKEEDKAYLLGMLLDEGKIDTAIIFMRRKSRTELIGEMLRNKGYNVAELHGDLPQRIRQKHLDGFRAGKYSLLIATDVAARGLDIEAVSHVINYDIPEHPDDYIHRIGRTARAKAEGDAITFVTPQEYKPLESLERALGHSIPRAQWERAPRVLTLFHAPGERPRGARRRAPKKARRRR